MQTGVSLSSLLQARSAASAVARKQQRAERPSSPLPDIDAIDCANPLAACNYVNDIYRCAAMGRGPASSAARQSV